MNNKYSGIPAELKALPNWVLWKFEYKDGPDKKPTKVPYHPKGFRADPTNPAQWVDFDQAFATFQFGGYDGLGFCFGNTPYSGIDLDDAHFIKGKPNPNYEADFARQLRIYQEFNSYSETSPSGKGCHIIVRGKVPSGHNRACIELYSTDRFFTMTGNVANDVPIAERSELLKSLHIELGGDKAPSSEIDRPQTTDDQAIIDLALKHNTVTFEPLHKNGYVADGTYTSQSEADQAYANIIAYYTDNQEQCVRIFKNSKLYRKPPLKHKNYPALTVKKAFDLKVPTIVFDGINEAWAKIREQGSVAQRSEPTPHKRSDTGSNPVTSTISVPPGLLGDIANFMYGAAPKPVMEISIAGAIGLMAGICGKAYNVKGLGLNQYVLMVAGTGKGKEQMASGISKLINSVKLGAPMAPKFIGPSAIASKQGLHKWLAKNSSCFVSIIGEFGLALKAMSSNKATSHQIELQAALLDIYHKSGFNDTYGGSAYSDQDKNTAAIQSPAFTILAETTEDSLYGNLDEQMINSGLLPRFTIIEYKGIRVPTNEEPNSTPSIDLTTKLGALITQANTVIETKSVINVQFTDEARALCRNIDTYADAKVNDNDKEFVRNLWTRANVKAMKLASLVAIGVDPSNPTITTEHLNWAMTLVDNDIKSLSSKFESGEVGSNTDELKQMNEAMRIIKEYAEKEFSYVAKYRAIELQHKNKVINNTYLAQRLSRVSVFKNDRIGATNALKRTMQTLIDNGYLVELKGEQLTKYNTTAKCYKIHHSILV